MERVTRRRCVAMASLPVLAGLGSYAARQSGLGSGSGRRRFAAAGPGAGRARIQQRHLPNVPLLTHDGERVRFYDDLVRDRKVVLTFVSSGAPRESQKVTDNLATLQRFFGARIGRDIFLYSIARTPERDTPDVLRALAARVGAGPGWTFLTGAPAQVEALRHGLGFGSDDPVEDADPAYAVSQLRHGVEPEMRWAHCQSQASARVIAHSLLLDFGAGTAAANSIPAWNCSLLLAGID
jgi:protein SCO1/2